MSISSRISHSRSSAAEPECHSFAVGTHLWQTKNRRRKRVTIHSGPGPRLGFLSSQLQVSWSLASPLVQPRDGVLGRSLGPIGSTPPRALLPRPVRPPPKLNWVLADIFRIARSSSGRIWFACFWSKQEVLLPHFSKCVHLLQSKGPVAHTMIQP